MGKVRSLKQDTPGKASATDTQPITEEDKAIFSLTDSIIELLKSKQMDFRSSVEEISPKEDRNVYFANLVNTKLSEAIIGIENNTNSIMYPHYFKVQNVSSDSISSGHLLIISSSEDKVNNNVDERRGEV